MCNSQVSGGSNDTEKRERGLYGRDKEGVEAGEAGEAGEEGRKGRIEDGDDR